MMHLPSLNLLERLALWVLVRSQRTSLVVVKELHWPIAFVAANQDDPTAAFVIGNQHDEPASHLLERLYHAPAYGELE